jgi:hypothetical protein
MPKTQAKVCLYLTEVKRIARGEAGKEVTRIKMSLDEADSYGTEPCFELAFGNPDTAQLFHNTPINTPFEVLITPVQANE